MDKKIRAFIHIHPLKWPYVAPLCLKKKKKNKTIPVISLVRFAASENSRHLLFTVAGYVSLPASFFSAVCQCGK